MSTTEIEVRQPRPQAQAAMLPAKVQYARELANSGLLPAAYRKNPGNVLYAVEFGEMLGLAPMAAITGVHVIEGKPTASAGLISALVRRAGHKLRVQGDGKSATCQIVRADDPDFTFEVTWTLRKNGDDNPSAEEAGLLNKNTWRNYPAAMLKSRAITQCARDACEEALFGLHYTAEELGAEVDEDGAVVAEIVADAQDAPQEDQWYVHPAPDRAAVEEWVAASLRVIPDIGLEACRKLWAETIEKYRSREIAEADSVKVLTPLKARMEALKNPAQDAETAPPAEPIEGKVVGNYGLDADDDWADKVADITRPEHADSVIAEASDLLSNEAMTPEHYARISVAVELRLAEITEPAAA